MSAVAMAIRRAYNDLGERRFAGICGAYLAGDAWFQEHVPACSRQEEVELRNLCPICAWAEWTDQHPAGDILCPLQPRRR